MARADVLACGASTLVHLDRAVPGRLPFARFLHRHSGWHGAQALEALTGTLRPSVLVLSNVTAGTGCVR